MGHASTGFQGNAYCTAEFKKAWIADGQRDFLQNFSKVFGMFISMLENMTVGQKGLVLERTYYGR